MVLEGADGAAILRTPRLTGHLACRAAIASLRLVTLLDDHYHRYRTSEDAFAFAVRRPGAGVLAWSTAFPDEATRERAIEIVRRGAPGASVVQSPIGAFTLDPRTGLPQSGAHVVAPSDAVDATPRSTTPSGDEPGDVPA